jgi:hypothetical protein
MTGRLVVPGVLALALALCCGAQEQRAALSVDICDLVQRPDDYAGKIVRLRADVNSGWTKPGRPITGFSIKQPFSSVRCHTQLKVVLPESADHTGSVELRRDDAFKTLEQALHTSMTAAATFQGRFESSATAKSGKARLSGMRLVLEAVSDVDARVVYNK